MRDKLYFLHQHVADLISGVLLLSVPPSIEWYDFVPADGSLAHGAHLAAWPCLQPLVQAGPTAIIHYLHLIIDTKDVFINFA